jgi:hypothetical protein
MLRALSIASVVLCAGSLIPANATGLLRKKSPPKTVEVPAQPVFYSGVELRLVPESPAPKQRIVNVGPWMVGARVGDGKPSDKRLNLYIVAPGKQYKLDDYAQFDHNLIISALPKEDKQAEYDVWWALILDPTLQTDFQDEHELIIAAQGRFKPSRTFDVKEAPSFSFLQKYLGIRTNSDLEEYYREEKTLPRVLIVPAKFAVRAAVESVPQPEAPANADGATPAPETETPAGTAKPSEAQPAQAATAPAAQ